MLHSMTELEGELSLGHQGSQLGVGWNRKTGLPMPGKRLSGSNKSGQQ